jgi:predicted nucleic acid-binding Zn ribbon protein
MGYRRLIFSALTVMASTAVAAPAFGQPSSPSPVDIPDTPRPWHRPAPKSDEHRIVGKVLQIERDQGLAKLATDEGVLVVEVPSPTLRAFRIGDIVSVSRSGAESPSASPRTK